MGVFIVLSLPDCGWTGLIGCLGCGWCVYGCYAVFCWFAFGLAGGMCFMFPSLGLGCRDYGYSCCGEFVGAVCSGDFGIPRCGTCLGGCGLDFFANVLICVG